MSNERQPRLFVRRQSFRQTRIDLVRSANGFQSSFQCSRDGVLAERKKEEEEEECETHVCPCTPSSLSLSYGIPDLACFSRPPPLAVTRLEERKQAKSPIIFPTGAALDPTNREEGEKPSSASGRLHSIILILPSASAWRGVGGQKRREIFAPRNRHRQ